MPVTLFDILKHGGLPTPEKEGIARNACHKHQSASDRSAPLLEKTRMVGKGFRQPMHPSRNCAVLGFSFVCVK